ncbi:REP-associated tyrosine transposase [Pararhodobacter sp.]|uniref:REP-associated tyrosine transposase n=1 Tax=Pararhodobacter sp. TaxID=2127056 RepID=UPI002AFFB58F|nr:transposase [Pararhodobacter sp.]
MSEYRRPRIPGATVFFTVALAQQGSSLLLDEIDRLRDAVAATRRARPFAIDAFVVLPDHLHCIWTLPDGDTDYSQRWRLIKTRFSQGLPIGHRRASQRARQERGIWQRRFWEHHIRNDADYREHLAYCWNDPVKHALVGTPQEWPFSSIHRDIAVYAGP